MCDGGFIVIEPADRRADYLASSPAPGPAPFPGMAWIPGGRFAMGADGFYPEERPVHTVQVSGFWMDVAPVTNEQFAAFVAATGYRTMAEFAPEPSRYPGAQRELLVPGALVFRKTQTRVNLDDPAKWWAYVPGADWRHPRGPNKGISGMARHPVVQVAYDDAEAFARWVGKALPTEAEWEFAARGGLNGAVFVWGNTESASRPMANTWQGEFPWHNKRTDGYEGTSPVGAFPANGYSLYDMAGNVWEWTSDWYKPRHPETPNKPCCTPTDPTVTSAGASFDPSQPQIRIPRKVLKGGSHLCAPNYCFRYRPAARSAETIDTSTCHIGFRCVVRMAKTDDAHTATAPTY